jgi:hypothetical protein
MATTKGFDKYIIRVTGDNSGRVALLLCYSGNSFVGRIDFYPDGTSVAQDYLWHPSTVGEYVVLHMPMSRFDSVMSIVRNEKPLNLYINLDRGSGASTQGSGYLATTDKEPVGEEEGTS